MEPINLNPRYSTTEVPGKCIKCLAEQEMNNCLLELLRQGGVGNRELEERFEALVAFLKSPESQKLRDEAERYLAEGKQVSVDICLEEGEPVYRLRIKEQS